MDAITKCTSAQTYKCCMDVFLGIIVCRILGNFNFFFFVQMFVVAQFLLNVADVRHFKNLFSVWKGVMEEVLTRYFNQLTIILKPILIV